MLQWQDGYALFVYFISHFSVSIMKGLRFIILHKGSEGQEPVPLFTLLPRLESSPEYYWRWSSSLLLFIGLLAAHEDWWLWLNFITQVYIKVYVLDYLFIYYVRADGQTCMHKHIKGNIQNYPLNYYIQRDRLTEANVHILIHKHSYTELNPELPKYRRKKKWIEMLN